MGQNMSKTYAQWIEHFKGYSQGGPDTDESGEAVVLDEYVPEGGEIYESPTELEEDDFIDEETEETEEVEASQEVDDEEESEETEDEPVEKPAEDPVAGIKAELQKEREERLKLEGMLKQMGLQTQQQPKAEQQPQVRKYQNAIDDYVARGGDKSTAQEMQKIFDAFYEDINPTLATLQQHAQHTQQFEAQIAADREKNQAANELKTGFGATDDEIASAEEYAQRYYAKVAQGEAPFKDYGDLFKLSLFEQRHAGQQQATKEDQDAESKRLEAQRRAGKQTKPGATRKPAAPTVPKSAKGNFAALRKHWAEQGMVVPD